MADMRKCFGLIFAVTLIALALSVEARAGFRPNWSPGDSWQVSVIYIRGERAGETWSEPEIWVYQVSEGSGKKGNTDLIIKIHLKMENAEPLMEVHLDRGTLAVTKKMVFRRAGEQKKPFETEIPEIGVPVPTGFAPAPVDIPAFPLIPGQVREFKYLKKVAGGLFTREVIRQDVKRVESPKENGSRVMEMEEDILEVTCTDGRGREIFTQRWAEGTPWPLSGRNESMEYHLVRP